MPGLRIHRERGGPSFVRRGADTVSLVPEVTVYQLSFAPLAKRTISLVRPHAVFIIDREGVERVRRDPERFVPPLLLVLVVVVPLALLLKRRPAGRLADN